MLKKLTFVLLTIVLSILFMVTIESFLFQTSGQSEKAPTKPLLSPESQLLLIAPQHPLINFLHQAETKPSTAKQQLLEWQTSQTQDTAIIEQIYILWIEQEIAKQQNLGQKVRDYQQELAELAQEEGIYWLQAQLALDQAVASLKSDRYSDGLEKIELAIKLAETHQAEFLLLESYNTAGILYNASNQLKQSQRYFLQGVELGKKYPQSDFNGRFYNNLGLLYVHLELWDKALEHLTSAEQFYLNFEQTTDNVLIIIYLNKSYVYNQLQDPHLSRQSYLKAMSYFSNETPNYYSILALKAKARMELLLGNASAAEQDALQCLAYEGVDKRPKQAAICQYIQAKALHAQGLNSESIKVMTASIDKFQHIAHHRWLIRSNLVLASVYEADGQYEKALQLYKHYHGKERRQIIDEFHVLETAFEVREVEKERDLLSVQNELIDLENQLNDNRMRILAFWFAVILLVTLWFISRSVMDRRQNRYLQDLSYRDPLTGGGNRRLYYQELKAPYALNTKHSYRVVLVDLDWFKSINDGYGHEVGDEVLAEVAKILRSQLKEHELFIRWGGEEFLLLIQDQPDFRMRAQSLVNSISKSPLALPQHQLPVSISVGVSAACSIDDLRQDSEMFIVADKCLYRAKHQGRNQFVTVEDLSD
ncbi:tetratricopeptide repeat-containing diguanylate cyclase [Vibrio scophthalmi]|uniref:diguanylate cyclase n=1 Tax=Vibrio scophthalmi LMG 19158 TaxID=870967 RepID=F9RST9_9VIBR|nr:GGDEF domain-containing protein [Vibrio scophthalmi]EGU31639.1 hypothetical protein VIS19158_18811 [Vibrio scophthalmi LMG 19158]